jgi:hypothetical protein
LLVRKLRFYYYLLYELLPRHLASTPKKPTFHNKTQWILAMARETRRSQ